ncbi:MAG: DUF4468 domain-containing protein [Bacteroidota bacterium]
MRFLASLLVALLFFNVGSSAQKKQELIAPALNIDSVTKLITYEGVLEVKGVDASTLYGRTEDWFNTFYKNPAEVIRENDSVKLRITGKPRFKISNPADKSGLRTDAGVVQYTITVVAREGRFRYEISEFNWKQNSYYPCERWLDKSSQSWLPAYYDYLGQIDITANQVIKELHKALSVAKSQKNREDW